MERRRWSYKVAKRVAKERSQPLRSMWCTRASRWPQELLCFVDESAANEKTGYRKRGWSPAGIDCVDLQSTRRSERWSILPALTVNGYLAGTKIVQGAITAEIFNDWLQNTVLPQLVPGMILVMDNASIHRSYEVAAMCAEADITVEYLPPYSPDFNPIEQTFNVLKAWIRRHIDEARGYEDFGWFLVHAVKHSISDAQAHFVKAGYYSHTSSLLVPA